MICVIHTPLVTGRVSRLLIQHVVPRRAGRIQDHFPTGHFAAKCDVGVALSWSARLSTKVETNLAEVSNNFQIIYNMPAMKSLVGIVLLSASV